MTPLPQQPWPEYSSVHWCVSSGDYWKYYKDMLALVEQLGPERCDTRPAMWFSPYVVCPKPVLANCLFSPENCNENQGGVLFRRATLTFYETLQTDFEAEVTRLAEFLGVPLPAAKLEKLAEYVAFDNMASRGMMTTRKGVTRDYENHLSAEKWAEVDEIFAEKMGDVLAFAPLAPYMTG
eukprot:COSAG06_NODE_3003_length_5970_cov_3.618123_6_plen_180_part_00